MKLPSTIERLTEIQLDDRSLVRTIRERRDAIRNHRDQKLDDRCWLDDYVIWSMLDDSPEYPTALPPFVKMMAKCKEFYEFRREQKPDPAPPDAEHNSGLWDADLRRMTYDKLILELHQIQQAIHVHRNVVNRPRTVNDDRRLYSVLPEKMPADFRMPPRKEFLGEAKGPHAGCPSFWRSHMRCKGKCDVHAWGPCPR